MDISHEPWGLSECDIMWLAWTLQRVAFHTSWFHIQGFSHSFLATEKWKMSSVLNTDVSCPSSLNSAVEQLLTQQICIYNPEGLKARWGMYMGHMQLLCHLFRDLTTVGFGNLSGIPELNL